VANERRSPPGRSLDFPPLMTNRLFRLPLFAALALLAALTLAACGAEETTTQGHSEGSYIKAGSLVYQVQMSRELNPANVEDAELLEGLSASQPALAGDEEWFGVWVRAQNITDEPARSAEEFKIVDTTGSEYEPIELPETNPLVYTPALVEGKDGQPVLPDPESAAAAGPVQGSMLLFKLRTDVYSNRPLEFEVVPPDGGEPASVELDL
jgi:hypothetical protein